MGAHVVRPPTRLDMRDDLPLEPGEVCQRRHYNKQQDGDLDYRCHQDWVLGDEVQGASFASSVELSLEQ